MDFGASKFTIVLVKYGIANIKIFDSASHHGD